MQKFRPRQNVVSTDPWYDQRELEIIWIKIPPDPNNVSFEYARRYRRNYKEIQHKLEKIRMLKRLYKG